VVSAPVEFEEIGTVPKCSAARSLRASKLDAVQKRWRRLVVTIS
jgi:hypothetical protein